MGLDQAFGPAAAGLVDVFQGLHCWHRDLEEIDLCFAFVRSENVQC